MNKLIGVTIGDINGIGIDIFLKLYLNSKIKNVILFCNIIILKNYLKKNKINLKLNLFNKSNISNIYKKSELNIYSYKANSHESNTINSIIYSHNECVKRIIIGVITLPIRKDIIIKKIDRNFTGHTEFLSNLENKEYTNMILIHNKIIVSPLTTHISLKKVSKEILKKDFILNQIINLNNTLKIDLNIKNPRIIIAGLNPHAGENGKIGTEEITVNKVIKNLKNKNINITGTVSADSMLLNIKNYDCFIFMYHDQALIPFKYISKFSGVNFTGNLDIIRVSPDHGTAYNLKGSKNISDTSIKKCFNLINKINKNRSLKYASKKIT